MDEKKEINILESLSSGKLVPSPKWRLPSTISVRTCGMFLWSQSVLSLKLIVDLDTFWLGYFTMFPYVGCSFDLQLWVSKLNFHVTELETLRYFCHFSFLIYFGWFFPAQIIDYFIRLTVQIIFSFLLIKK